jgi:hypothetical protein
MTEEEILKLCGTPDWKWGTSEGAELHTLLLGLTTTFQEKLEWLEEMETMILKIRAAESMQEAAKSRRQIDSGKA